MAGAVGTDYSTQNAAQYSGTDLTVDATLNTKVTSATHPFISSDVGNLIQITAGTGFTTGFYWIVSISAGAATLDRSPGATSITGGSYAVGGALATFSKLATAIVAGCKVFVKADGNYTPAATTTLTASVASPSPTGLYTQVEGYATTRGDGGKAQLNFTGTTGPGLTFAGSGWRVRNLSINGNNMTNNVLNLNASVSTAEDCRVTNYLGVGISATATQSKIHRCEVSGGTSVASIGITSGSGVQVIQCVVHDGLGTGIGQSLFNLTVSDCLVYNLTGAGANAISITQNCAVRNNTVYNVAGNGIHNPSANMWGEVILNNVLAKCGGYGISLATAAGAPASPTYDGNAFWSNTAGNRQNMDDAGAVNALNAVAPYTNTRDVACSVDPFVNAAAGDFRLNSTAGGGAAIRGAASPVPPGSTAPANQGYRDMGAVQHQDAGAGGMLYNPGLDGV